MIFDGLIIVKKCIASLCRQAKTHKLSLDLVTLLSLQDVMPGPGIDNLTVRPHCGLG